MNKAFIGHIFALIALVSLGSCNSSDDDNFVIPDLLADWEDVSVKSFNLLKNDSVLAKLDTVFFAIDLQNARIYNPDSLPKGTKVNKLQINLTYATVKKAELKYVTVNGTDTIYELTNDNKEDSLNFANGPVILRLTSMNEKVVRDYQISVNVHEMLPDSLAWGDLAYSALPAKGTPVAQHTTMDGEKAACFTLDAAGRLSCARNINDEMTFGTPEDMGVVPAGFDINTVTVIDGAIYAVAANRLVRYTAAGAWADLSTPMSWIYGEYDGRLMGYSQGSVVTYPATTPVSVGAGFPVKGTSQMLVYTSEWATDPMAIMVGGQTADGKRTGATWAFDGTTWAEFNEHTLPDAEGYAIAPYFTFRVNSIWQVTERDAILAFGGLTEADTCQATTYVSYDRGLHWSKAGDLLQLPSYVTPRYNAQCIVMPQTKKVGSRAGSLWTSCKLPALPGWLRVDGESAGSRATKPLTEWECPYIYMFGGLNADGELDNEVWRGVINRLSFVPLY